MPWGCARGCPSRGSIAAVVHDGVTRVMVRAGGTVALLARLSLLARLAQLLCWRDRHCWRGWRSCSWTLFGAHCHFHCCPLAGT
jgi:hypothetical protein